MPTRHGRSSTTRASRSGGTRARASCSATLRPTSWAGPRPICRPPERGVHDSATLICEVSDTSHTAPHLRRARTYDEGGRGLLLVAQLTQRWGSRHTADGRTIWAELNLTQM